MIIRVEHHERFTVIRDQTLRDSRLSLKATGLLAYLLSLPDDAPLSRDYIVASKLDGVRSVRSGLRELTDAGYIEHRRVQDEHGQWRTEAVVYERPQVETEGAKRAIGRQPTDGAFRASNPNTRERAASSSTPPPPPPEYQCAACGEPARYMRPDESWWCKEHYRGHSLRVVGDEPT